MGLGDQRQASAAFSRERSGTHFIGDVPGFGAGLDSCGNSFPHWDSIPGRSSP